MAMGNSSGASALSVPPVLDELHACGELPRLIAMLCTADRGVEMKGSHKLLVYVKLGEMWLHRVPRPHTSSCIHKPFLPLFCTQFLFRLQISPCSPTSSRNTVRAGTFDICRVSREEGKKSHPGITKEEETKHKLKSQIEMNRSKNLEI